MTATEPVATRRTSPYDPVHLPVGHQVSPRSHAAPPFSLREEIGFAMSEERHPWLTLLAGLILFALVLGGLSLLWLAAGPA